MRIKEIPVYKFEELSEAAKAKAVDSLIDINVDHDWWDGVYEDAERIGLKITEFDLGRSRVIKGDLVDCPEFTIEKIKEEHGSATDTYVFAQRWKNETWKDEDGDRDEDKDAEFLRDLLEEYWHILNREYEYLTSEEAIVEAIETNEYEFTGDGRIA